MTSNWDDLIFGLERALEAARRLRSFYNEQNKILETPTFRENMSVPQLIIEIAKLNGGKLVVKDANLIVAAYMLVDRGTASNSIYANLNYDKKHNQRFAKLGIGVYQIQGESIRR